MNMNRMVKRIEKMEHLIDTFPPEKIAHLEQSFDTLSNEELFQYNNWQIRAFSHQIITLEEAQTLHHIIGGDYPTVERFMERPLAERLMMTQIMEELGAIFKDR